jgi:amino acid transporter
MVGITVLYLLLQVVAQGVLGPGLALATVSPLADTAQASLGGWARIVLLVGATVSMFGYLGGVTLSMPRLVYAFARDGFLPKTLADINPGNQSPSAAIIMQSTVTLAFALSGTFEKLALLANVAALVLYFGCAVAAWKLRADGVTTDGQKPFNVPFASVLPWVTCLVIVWLLTGLTRDEWFAFGVCVAVGSVAYLLRARRTVTA